MKKSHTISSRAPTYRYFRINLTFHWRHSKEVLAKVSDCRISAAEVEQVSKFQSISDPKTEREVEAAV